MVSGEWKEIFARIAIRYSRFSSPAVSETPPAPHLAPASRRRTFSAYERLPIASVMAPIAIGPSVWPTPKAMVIAAMLALGAVLAAFQRRLVRRTANSE